MGLSQVRTMRFSVVSVNSLCLDSVSPLWLSPLVFRSETSTKATGARQV